MSAVQRIFIIGSLISYGCLAIAGQDLGSSNKLFGGSKSSAKTPAKSSKKTAAKPRTTAKPKTTAAKTNAGAKSGTTTTTSKTAIKATTFKTGGETKSGSGVSNTRFIKPIAADKGKAIESRVDTPPISPKGSGLTGAAADNLFEELIDEGNIARDNRSYSIAEAAYKRARTVKSKDARAVYGLGNLYSDQQRWGDAESAYRTALELDPGSATAHVALSYVLMQPLALPDLGERYKEAEYLARRAIQLAPANALAFDQLGVALELRGLIDSQTESQYRRSIQLDPSFAPAYAHLGRLLRRRGMTSESAAAYEEAIARSTDVPTKVLVAEIMQSEQRFAESEKLLGQALVDDPRNPSGLLLMGRALMAQSKLEEAESVLKRSLTITTNGFMANSLLGSLYTRQGKLELAENVLLQALRHVGPYEKSGLAQQFEAVGDGYMKTSRRGQAERAYRQAIALDAERESLAGKLARAQRS